MKKQIISILFILVLVLPAVVSYTYFQYRKKEIKREVKLQLATLNFNKLVVLKFSNQELDAKVRWKHSKEFEFEGKMFDIIQSKKDNDSISFWCWLDKQETELNTKLKTFLVDAYQIDKPIKESEIRFYNFYKTLFFVSKNYVFFFKNSHNLFIKNSFKKSCYNFLISSSEFRPPIIFSL